MSSLDVVVIGGGIAGAGAAYELSARSDVVLLEAEATCGQHATGRSAAVFTECYGLPQIRRLALASRPFLESPPDGFAEQPLLTARSIMFVGRADQVDLLDALWEEAIPYVPDVVRLDPDATLRRCTGLRPDQVAGGMFEPRATDIDVHALHQGFLAGLRRRGGQVHTGARVDALTESSAGWTVRAGGRTFHADVVVDAAGAWADDVARRAGVAPVGLRPMRRTAFTCPVPAGLDHRNWPLVIDAAEQWYFKPEGPGLLASPADEIPQEPGDARPREIDVAVGVERINAMTILDIRHVSRSWAGLRSFVRDRLPVAGMDPDHPGFFWLAGQGGYGIKTSPALGRVTAGLILDGALPADLVAAGVDARQLDPARLRGQDAK